MADVTADVAIRFQVEGQQDVRRELENITSSTKQLGGEVEKAAGGGGGFREINDQVKSLNGSIQEALPSASGFTDKLNDWAGAALKVAGPLAAAAAAAGAFAIKLGLSGVKEADAMRLMAQRIGESVEGMSKLEYHAKLTDTSFQSIATAMGRLSQNLGGENSKAAETLEKLGISLEQFKASDAAEKMALIADGLDRIGDTEGKLAALKDMFGRGSLNMLPFFEGGAKAIRESSQELEKFGGVISTQTAQNADAYNDNLTRLSQALAGVRTELAAGISGSLKELSGAFVFLLKDSGGLRAFVQVLSALAKALLFVAKVIASVIISISAVAGDLERILDGLLNALGALSKGNFRAGWDALKDAMTKMATESQKTKQALQDLWGIVEEGTKAQSAAEAAASGNAKATQKQGDAAGEAAGKNRQLNKQLEDAGKANEKMQKGAAKASGAVAQMAYQMREAVAMLASYNRLASDGAMFQYAAFGMPKKPSISKGRSKDPTGAGVPTREDWDDLMYEMRSFSRQFANELNEMLWNAENRWKEFFTNIAKMVTQILLQRYVARPMEKAINTILDSIEGGLVSAIAGGGSVAAGSEVTFGGDALISAPKQFAAGGTLRAGYWGLVGERGAELIAPESHNRRVIPNDQIGGQSIVVNQNFSVGLAQTVRAEVMSMMPMFRATAVSAVREASRRGAL